MTTEQAHEIFNAAHVAAIARGDLEGAAKIEVSREYFTNAEFRKTLQDYLWNNRK